jgi:hypothetical protein
MASPIEKSFCVIEYAKKIRAPVFRGSCDFFLWGYVKEQGFVPPLPLDIDELTLRITAAIETTDRNVLERVWDELDYRLDICGSRIELAMSIFRVCKTFRICHSNGTSCNCIAVILILV